MSHYNVDMYPVGALMKAKKLLKGAEYFQRKADQFWRNSLSLMEESGKAHKYRGRCFTCGERGHHYRDCWVSMVTDKVCFWCGKQGHVQRHCRMNKAIKIVPKGDPQTIKPKEGNNVKDLIENARRIVVTRNPSPPPSPSPVREEQLAQREDTNDGSVDVEEEASLKSDQLQSIDLSEHSCCDINASECSQSSPMKSSSQSLPDDNNQYEIVSSVSTESFENVEPVARM